MNKHKRKCKSCNTSKWVEAFPKDGTTCKPCLNKRNKESHLKRTFGLTMQDYLDMLKQQGGVCAICGKLPKAGKRFAVDHDHRSGRIRGLLCYLCNYGIGMWRDDTARFVAAGKYLTDPPCNRYVEDLGRANGKGLMRKSTGPLAIAANPLADGLEELHRKRKKDPSRSFTLEDLE